MLCQVLRGEARNSARSEQAGHFVIRVPSSGLPVAPGRLIQVHGKAALKDPIDRNWRLSLTGTQGVEKRTGCSSVGSPGARDEEPTGPVS
jgi:hypothetical protein